MRNLSKIIVLTLSFLTLSLNSFAVPIEWTSGDHEIRAAISELSTYNNVTVSMYQGGAVGQFYMYGNSAVTAYSDASSPVSYLYLYDNTSATFHNGIGPMQVYIEPESTANIYLYAYDVEFDGGLHPELHGYWLSNNMLFNIYLNDTDDSAFSYFHVIPEPATLALFALGGLLLRKRRK
ncbi:MAG: PEP-CTERM sorting domain-containing protein [Phycisphaerae bacterium]|jgi:hypothetical protein